MGGSDSRKRTLPGQAAVDAAMPASRTGKTRKDAKRHAVGNAGGGAGAAAMEDGFEGREEMQIAMDLMFGENEDLRAENEEVRAENEELRAEKKKDAARIRKVKQILGELRLVVQKNIADNRQALMDSVNDTLPTSTVVAPKNNVGPRPP